MFILSRFKRHSSDYNVLRYMLWLLLSNIFFTGFVHTFTPSRMKVWLLRVFGATIGNQVLIKPSVQIKYPWKLSVGNSVWIGEHVWFENVAAISIGNNVCISQGVKMITGNHDFTSPTFDLLEQPIVIGDNVWIGCFNIILPNSSVASNSVVKAPKTERRVVSF